VEYLHFHQKAEVITSQEILKDQVFAFPWGHYYIRVFTRPSRLNGPDDHAEHPLCFITDNTTRYAGQVYTNTRQL
jgi:hypothetical protein